ncbi:MAG: methanogen output domain 1-containing protein [Roseovarius sp.]|uniref:methanogen output domain 1-containing protein n=1 Tax=Roseovarius sp. TaxID=1486281 RepID=UPI0032EC7518
MEDTIGLVEASSFVGQVGDELGASISRRYAEAMRGLPEEPGALADILSDLKSRIGGNFSVESVSETEIVLVNSACPFADRVKGRPSLCMMTTNVFGRIVSDARGYARVNIEKAIATGHPGCRVRVSLQDDDAGDGFEFFR